MHNKKILCPLHPIYHLKMNHLPFSKDLQYNQWLFLYLFHLMHLKLSNSTRHNALMSCENRDLHCLQSHRRCFNIFLTNQLMLGAFHLLWELLKFLNCLWSNSNRLLSDAQLNNNQLSLNLYFFLNLVNS